MEAVAKHWYRMQELEFIISKQLEDEQVEGNAIDTLAEANKVEKVVPQETSTEPSSLPSLAPI